MTSSSPTGPLDDRIRAEAAVWIARLHGPDRSPAMERGLRKWLAERQAHAEAFELATDAWHKSGNLPGCLPRPEATAPDVSRAREPGYLRLRPIWALVSVCVAAVVIGVMFFPDAGIRTEVGEQRTLFLADGTRVELNTQTRLAVHYDARERRVVLESGEAFFNVTKHEPRPFVVVAGERKVIAVGTSFVVRREDVAEPAFTVTLLEGRVAVAPVSRPSELPPAPLPEVTVLSAGERAMFRKTATPALDRPAMNKVTGWMHGQLIFDDTPLSDAAAEFNRYSPVHITLRSSEAGAVRVGGVFRIGDSASFARAVADAHHLTLVVTRDEIVLDSQRASGSDLKN